MASKHSESIEDALDRHPPVQCAARGCTSTRHRLGPWCRRHESRLRYSGHPTLRPPSGRFRTRLRKLVRDRLDKSKLPDELLAFLDRRRELLTEWSTTLRHDVESEAAGRLARVDPLDLLAAAVAFEFHWQSRVEPRELVRDVPSGWFTVDREQRMRNCQLRIWMLDLPEFRRFPRRPSCRDAVSRLMRMLMAYRSPTTLAQVAFVLTEKLGPVVLDALAEIAREEQERSAARAAAQARELAPYGINPDGTFDIYRADDDQA